MMHSSLEAIRGRCLALEEESNYVATLPAWCAGTDYEYVTHDAPLVRGLTG